MTDWTSRPGAVETFARFCAPTALAALLGCTKAEAAKELLSQPRMAHRDTGSVRTTEWLAYCVRLGGTEVSAERDIETQRALSYERYGDARWGLYEPTITHPTVAQWLRANPGITAVLSVRGHTLLVRDGEVAADSMRTKSKRARVLRAVIFPEGT